jgi:UDP-N-acetylglucosamine--N-acetylmuramyl-(pentapeptide) pyrophosphoryl-undecaprenol N-acetylglucosamine transferase
MGNWDLNWDWEAIQSTGNPTYMKILISGGHLTPALAFIDFVQSHQKHDDVVFVGRLFAKAGNAQLSQEKTEIEKRNLRFIPFTSGKMQSTHIFSFIPQLGAFGVSLVSAYRLIAREKPDVFLSFGGYLAVPLAFACSLKKIPIVTHEQTRTAGVANKIIAKLAQVVAVSYEETTALFPGVKTVVTGNPIRKALLQPGAQQPEWFSPAEKKPILYITGGSQGARFINLLVQEVLPELLKNWIVIHQCGKPTKEMKYREILEKKRAMLPEPLQRQYFIKEWVSDEELRWIYQHATGIVSRAGANTVQEIIFAAKPVLFIPLPNSHENEQYKNAVAMVEAAAGLLLPQSEATTILFLAKVEELFAQKQMLQKAAQLYREKFSLNADQHLYEVVYSVVHS